MTGIAQPAIARIEREGVSPTVETLERLLAGTGYSAELAPRLGVGVDRTLIREMLQRTPEDRLLAAARSAQDVAALAAAAQRGRRA